MAPDVPVRFSAPVVSVRPLLAVSVEATDKVPVRAAEELMVWPLIAPDVMVLAPRFSAPLLVIAPLLIVPAIVVLPLLSTLNLLTVLFWASIRSWAPDPTAVYVGLILRIVLDCVLPATL